MNPMIGFLLIHLCTACLPSLDPEPTTTTLPIISTTDVSTTLVSTTTDMSTTDISTTLISSTIPMTTISMMSSTITIADPCPTVCPSIYSPMCYGGYGFNCLDDMTAMVMIAYDPMTTLCTMTFTCPGPQMMYVQDAMSGTQAISAGLTSVTCSTAPANGWIVPATMQSIDGLVCNDVF